MARYAALLLPLALVIGAQPADAQSHSKQDAHANEKWAQILRKEWLAKHGGKTPATTAPMTGKTTPSVPAPAPAAVHTSPDTAIKPIASTTSTTSTTPIAPMSPQPSTSAVTAAPSVASTSPVANAAKPITSTGNAASNAPASPIHNPQPTISNSSLLSQTKPDIYNPNDPAVGKATTGVQTRDNPMASVGETWKMIVFLVPVLLGIVGFLHLLKRFQARTGRLPDGLQSAGRNVGGTAQQRKQPASGGIWNALLGGFHLNNARQAAGSSIRLIESMPIGGANVHLLEVRGRVLLLGASPAGLSLLTEFEERNSAATGDFRDLLHAAAADMDAMDYAQDDLPATATVSTLEELMREAGQSVAKNARRLRDVEIDD